MPSTHSRSIKSDRETLPQPVHARLLAMGTSGERGRPGFAGVITKPAGSPDQREARDPQLH